MGVGGAVTARLIQGQALISICAVATVSCGCNGVFAYLYLCVPVMLTAFVAEQVAAVVFFLIYCGRVLGKPGDFRQPNSSC